MNESKDKEAGRSRTAVGEVLIRLEDLWKSFGALEVLKGLKLDIRKGETVVIIGGSGSGKSVILKHIIGLLRPDRGRVVFDHIVISEESEKNLAEVRERFGMVFQGAALFDSMTVLENVAFGLRRHTDYGEDRIRRTVSEKLRLVGLSGVEDKMPAELSGGMKKRVGVARAIAMEPEVILYDEPTAGLDPVMSDVISDLIMRVQKSQHATSVVVTHDMKNAYKIADRIAMLGDGRIIEEGTAAAIQSSANPAVRSFVRGEADARMKESLERA
jgi:phospholipid/cholesterol/gamma-HCH transport system ATP-binding protein